MNKDQPQTKTTQAAHQSRSRATTTHHTPRRRRRGLNPFQRPITLRGFLQFGALGLLAVLIAGGVIFYFWHQGYYYYSTDHAFVTGNVANITPDRTGTLSNIYYRVGDTVRAGDKVATLQKNNGGSYDATSPIDGQIVSEGSLPTILVGTGQVIQEGQDIAQVVDPSSIQITALVEGSHVKDIVPGQDVDVHVAAATSDTLHGTVNGILPVAANLAGGSPQRGESAVPAVPGGARADQSGRHRRLYVPAG